MKSLVAYLSQTGNTKKVADAIFGELDGEKELKKLDEVQNLEGYDLAFIGFPIHSAAPAKPAKVFLEANSANKKLALFVTHAAAEDAADLPKILEKCKAAALDAELVGVFDCQGELSPDVIAFLLKSENPAHRAFGEYGPQTMGQPDATRLDRARAFAHHVLETY